MIHSRSLFVSILLFVAMTLGAACQFGRSVSNPPRPTIVPVEASPTPTRPPTATAVAQQPSPPPSFTPTTPPTAERTDEPTQTPTVAPPTDTPPPLPTPTETIPPTPKADPVLPLESLSLKLRLVAAGLTKPLYLTHAGDGSGRLFVVEQAGRIFIIDGDQVNPTPFLDIVSIVGSDANEQGLLSLTFHPDYAANGAFFIYYTDKNGDVVIARYQVSDNPNRADPNSAQALLTIGQPYGNHNGGQLAFGPDGYLYAGLGDGGSGGDPQNNGQSLNTLLGKILRLDIANATPYGVPETNPFVNDNSARPEIWSYGWRNPWRFSFDRMTGDMYIADVGQNQYEEVNVELAGSPAGQNYGWRLMEGFHCFDPVDCDPAGLGVVLPIAEYDHGQGCSITGGYVYRGQRFPLLNSIYFYGDFCSGTVWGLRRNGNGDWSGAVLLRTEHTISSFGQDEAGELYLLDHRGGSILQIGYE